MNDALFSARAEDLRQRVIAFMEEHVYPAEHVFEEQLNAAPSRWTPAPIMEELKAKAKAEAKGRGRGTMRVFVTMPP